ncbi:thioredoxin-like protein [Limtongia smithiae]|uniref:thioredoxin-like protein n=1 Tax=Limtongia smithiae TaxID=1125753 RepID=UPI0034CE77CA
MRVLSLLLALVTAVLAAPAADDKIPATVNLDPGAFAASITPESGTWWVKYFSPYCPHCKAVAPIWAQVAADLHTTAQAADFHFANVDCIAHGDLCDTQKVEAYPTFILYRHGVIVERYPTAASRKYDALKDYATKHIEGAGARVAEPAAIAEDIDTTETPTKVTEVPAVVMPAGAQTASSLPNPSGVSVPLTLSTFNKLVTATRDGYFIKFYVPWCGHCQAMEPAWLELARQMQGRLNVAEVNCEDEKRLCKDARLRGYPSLMYFVGAERVEYDGLRGVGDLVAFANKAVAARLRAVDAAEFEEIEKKEEVIFLYFFDENTAKEDFDALDRVALPLIGHAPLFTTTSSILASRFRVTTFPRLVAISDGRPSYYTALSPRDFRDHLKVLAWMKTVWLPILPELSAANSHEIMQDRIVVLSILDKSKEAEFELAKKELKAAALEYMDLRVSEEKSERQRQRESKELKIEQATDKGDEKALKEAQSMHIVLAPRREIGFAWVDGLFWERWLQKTYDIDVRQSGPRVIINDEASKAYWDQSIDGKTLVPTDRQIIIDTLRTVLENRNKIKAKSTTSTFVSLVQNFKRFIHSSPLLIFGAIVAAVLVVAWWWKGKIRRLALRRSIPNSSAHSVLISPQSESKFD